MVNNYKRTTSQASWSPSAMRQAMREVQELGKTVKNAASKFGIPRTTLQRHLKSGTSQVKLGRFVTVFSADQERELLEYVFHMDNLFYGLSKQEFLELVYSYAEMNKITHPFKNGMAVLDWYKGFLRRHSNLTLRKPEPTSIARARVPTNRFIYDETDFLPSSVTENPLNSIESAEKIESSSLLDEASRKTSTPSLLETLASTHNVLPSENTGKDHLISTPALNVVSENNITMQIDSASSLPEEKDPHRTPSPFEFVQICRNTHNQTEIVSENSIINASISELKLPSPMATDRSIIPFTCCMENMNSPTDNLALFSCSRHVSPLVIRPVPEVSSNKTTRRRRAQKAEILTSTPIKDERRLKIYKKNKNNQKENIQKFSKTVKRNINTELSIKSPNHKKNQQKPKRETSNAKPAGSYLCFECHYPYEDPPVEDWIKCDVCGAWAHEYCTAYPGIGSFYCDMCQNI